MDIQYAIQLLKESKKEKKNIGYDKIYNGKEKTVKEK